MLYVIALLSVVTALSRGVDGANYQLRSADLALDAVARTADALRSEQRFQGSLPQSRVIRSAFVGQADLARVGIRGVRPGQYVLVQVRTTLQGGAFEVDSYAYDPNTHLLRYQSGRIVRRSKGMQPNCHQ